MTRPMICIALVFVVLVAINGLSLGTINEDDVILTREKRAISASTVKCDKQSFSKILDDCVTPKVKLEFFNSTMLKRCNNNKTDEALFDYMRTFLVNKFETAQNNSQGGRAIDFNSAAAVKELHPAVCFAECVFRALNLISPYPNDDQLNPWNAVSYFPQPLLYSQSAKYLAWVGATMPASYHCGLPIADYPVKNITMVVKGGSPKTCLTWPLMLTQCFFKNLMVHIPAKNYTKTSSCNNSVETLKICDPVPNRYEYSSDNL